MSFAMGASERLIELIRGGGDMVNYGGGCDSEMLESAERALRVRFPPSYRRLVEEFGTWEIAGEEFLGVYKTSLAGEALLGSSRETLDARSRYALPSELIVVMFDGMGGMVVLDSSDRDRDGEYPVYLWNPAVENREGMERLGDNFGTFALDLCQRAVRDW